MGGGSGGFVLRDSCMCVVSLIIDLGLVYGCGNWVMGFDNCFTGRCLKNVSSVREAA